MEITTDQISRIEKLLLPDGASFSDNDNERIDVIQSLETIDINACPGSGKTTTLLAKLLILAEQMPFDDGRGICVLTHTNVAIDELKENVDNRANNLFLYPNYFGTFQSFVNKYFAIPYYSSKLGKRPEKIDKEYYDELVDKVGWNANFTYQTNKNALYYLNVYPIKNKLCHNYNADGRKILTIGINGDEPIIKKPRGNDWSSKEKERVQAWLKAFKNRMLVNFGVLNFDDAYFFAESYLREIPKIKEVFSARFKYVFVDEMQDTYPHQKAIIDKTFDESVIVQRFGDPNQSIFGYVTLDTVWKPKKDALPIIGSKRFGENIAQILRTVCIRSNKDLKGNDQVNSFSPHIIVYDDRTVTKVLPRFVEIVKELEVEEISKQSKRPIKAVGWVGPDSDKPDKHTIKSYFQEYDRIANQKKSLLPSLRAHIRKYNTSKAKDYSDSIINAFLRILDLVEKMRETERGQRSYTKNTLLKYLWETDESFLNRFKENIATWAIGIQQSSQEYDSEVLKSIRLYIKDEFFPFFKIEFEGDVKEFITINLTDKAFDEEELSAKKNVFNHQDDTLKDIEVEVGTIHSVKGETHTATLYLETDYYSQRESDRILDQIKGIVYSNEDPTKDIRRKETLKMAYVGMSRPTHLLCLAVKKKNVEPNKEALEDYGWIIDTELIDD